MNLIEQLGGYEDAKTVVDKAPCKTYTYYNHPYQKGYIRCLGGDGKEYFLVSDIEQALLEYRRQHNIFEAGDAMVIPSRGNGIFHFNALFSDSDIAEARHATDEEIKAGKRLEVS